MDLIFVLLIAAGALALGGVGGYLIFRYVIKGKYKEMIETATKEADVIKEKKLLEVKEKFLNKKAVVDRILQSLAGLELGSLGSSDGHGLAGVRISAFSCSSLGNFESTEADKLNLLTLLELFSNNIRESLQSLLSILLGNFCSLADRSNDFCLVHFIFLLLISTLRKDFSFRNTLINL